VRYWISKLAASTLALSVASSAVTAQAKQSGSPSKLHLEEVGSDSTSFDVVATMIVGPSEVLLWDAQYHVDDAKRLADRIAATGKHLKAIVLSHPDHDHFAGAAVIVERFPGTPVYMTPTALAEYVKTAARDFGGEKSRRPAVLADSIVTPTPLPSNHLTVDGEAVDVIPDLQGDVLKPTNSMLFIPSLNAVLAGDVVFNGVHPWLGASDEASRTAWRAAVQQMKARHPAIVVAGHKKDVTAPDSPAVLDFMESYLADFDALKKTSANGQELAAAMRAKYPDLAVPVLIQFSAQAAFRPKGH
jgi:glyoxylase-like metal-dependent hydrolase (beta-lactamase superfamily II)